LCNEGTGQVAGPRSGKVEQRTENPRVPLGETIPQRSDPGSSMLGSILPCL
jgi:hypothetical protein